MRERKMNVTLAMAAIASLGAMVSCTTGGANDEVTTDEAALRAASAACVSARDACKMKLDTITSGIRTACTSRDACKAAFEAAKADLEAAAKSCETSVKAACVVDVGGHADGGSRGSFDGSIGGGGHGSFDASAAGRGRIPDGGLRGHVDSAACQAAEMTCRESLQSLLSMPPAACKTIQTACGGQTGTTPSDACKTAISDCKAALTSAATSTHEPCGSAIVAACGGHAG